MNYRKQDTQKEQYITIPTWLIKMTSNRKSPIFLTPFERELFCLIKGLSIKAPCYANDQYFASTFNVTIKHINKSISNLSNKTFLNIEHDNFKRLLSVNKDFDKDAGFVFFDNLNNKIFVCDCNNEIWTTRNDIERDTIDFFKKCS
ncbi:hypothetical protein M0G43_01685 [Subsaxibacter sp. CAU 1640]|uniref:hypothetical protein n=1 Tax=Subsaxibacter sp. CAU 1640 TaxID=2933271 RepID=UPI002002F215|nr:hypothetical protein [Subsaxibacter sp. CAU 1640]MCK7589276.1 hypothetical protein [Subsaxibacter sp. CAU 1640]